MTHRTFRLTEDIYTFGSNGSPLAVHIPKGTLLEVEEVEKEEEYQTKYPPIAQVFKSAQEENPEPKKQWKPQENQLYWIITEEGKVEDYIYYLENKWQEEEFEIGNCFRTKELAEKARDQVLETLKRFHSENQ